MGSDNVQDPVVEIPGAEEQPVSPPSDPWDEFLRMDDAEDENAEAPEADDDEGMVGDKDSAPVPPAAAPPSQELSVTPPVPQPETPPVAQAAEPPPVAPVAQEPVAPAPTPTAPTDLNPLREQWVKDLEGQYAIPEEDGVKYVTSAHEMLPAMAAKLHANIFDHVIQTVVGMMHSQLPTMIQNVSTSQKAVVEAEETFFSQWEELRPSRDRVLELAKQYRQLNPGLSREEFNKAVGMQAWIMLGKSPAELVVKLNGGQVPTGATAPSVPGKTISLPPVRPAGPSIPAVQTPSSGNVYEEMANTWFEDLD